MHLGIRLFSRLTDGTVVRGGRRPLESRSMPPRRRQQDKQRLVRQPRRGRQKPHSPDFCHLD